MTGEGAADHGEWDFFVSYTATDRAWAVWVAWVLEEVGFRVLVQEWDFVVGVNWVAEMDTGVARARRTVAVLSDDYARSVFGKAEWQAAWAADPEGIDRKLLVFRIADCVRPGLLGQMVSEDLFGCAEQVAREKVVVAARLAASRGRAKPEEAPPFPPSPRAVPERAAFPGELPGVWNVPARLARFVGRADQLEKVAEALRSKPGVVSVVALAGLGGVGKTSLAVEYAHRYSSDFDVVWWVGAERPDALNGQIATLGEEIGLPVGSEPVKVLDELRRLRVRWLLIFDNAENVQIVRPFRPADRQGRVLVTSRRAGWRAVGEVVEIPTLTRSESVALLSDRVPNIETAAADRIADLLGDLALAVEQAAAFCEQTGTPADEFVSLLEYRLDDVMELGEVAERVGVTVATLWEFSVTQLATSMPAALELLELLSYCGPEPLPLNLIAGRPNLGGTALSRAAADRLLWTRAVGALVDYSLASRDTLTVSMHRLVQAATRRRTSPARQRVVLTVLLRLLREDLPDDVLHSPQAWPRWRELLPHVRAVIDRVPDPIGPSGRTEGEMGTEASDLVWLCGRAGAYLHEQGQLAEAMPMLQRALTVTETVLGSGHPEVAIRLNNLASALHELGRANEALPLLQRSLGIIEDAYGPLYPQLATWMNNLASVLRTLGRAGEALPIYRRALGISENIHGLNHPEVGRVLNNLALTLRDLGRVRESLPLFERALKITEEHYGPEYVKVATRLNNLALALNDLGKAKEALPLFQRALMIDETTYGADHPEVARDLSNVAVALHDLGRTDEALLMLRRALAIDETVWGPDHPEVASRLSNLASALHALGRSGEALPLFQRGLNIVESAYGNGHPAIASKLNNMALVLCDLGRTDEALPMLRRALDIVEISYSSDHPEFARALNNMASILQRLGRTSEALPLLRRALVVAEAAYGIDHPNVVAVYANLKAVEHDLGE